MSQNQNTVRRGRPPVTLVLPRFCEITVNDIMERNQVCRLTAYNHLENLAGGKNSELYRSKITRPTGGVGKPMTVFFRRSMITPEIQADIDQREAQAAVERRKRAAIKAAKARKANASKGKAKAHKRTRKLATVPAIVMTPAPVTPEPAPVVTVNVDPTDIVSVPVTTPAPEPAPEVVPVVDLTADRSEVPPDVPVPVPVTETVNS